MRVVIGLLSILLFLAGPLYAQEISRDLAARVLVAEAGNQGMKGMICVAEVLRKRGSTKGFKIYNASKYKKLPSKIKQRAYKAWYESAHTNYTKGADHFANVRHFKKPWWVKYCVKTYEYKDHTFYRQIKRR